VRSEWLRRRAGLLAERNFRRYYAGYVTSLLGSSMSTVAIAWAVLDSGDSATGLGYVFATAGTFCYALPDIPMALHAAAGWVGAAAFACGAGAALSSTFFGTALQQQVPADRLARVNSLTLFPAYGVGVIGYAIDGPLASVLGAPVVFGVGAAYGLLSSAAVLALPSVRGLRWRDQAPASAPRQGPAGLGPSRLGPAGGAAKGGERGQPRDHGDDDRDREHLGQVTGRGEGDDAERDGDPAHRQGQRRRDPRSAQRPADQQPRLTREPQHHPGEAGDGDQDQGAEADHEGQPVHPSDRRDPDEDQRDQREHIDRP
jgi:hypothetical protein